MARIKEVSRTASGRINVRIRAGNGFMELNLTDEQAIQLARVLAEETDETQLSLGEVFG